MINAIAAKLLSFRRAIEFVRLSIPIFWKIQRGGWYCFRDCPDWYVAFVAKLEICPGDEASLVTAQKQAHAEMDLRLLRCLQEIKVLKGEMPGPVVQKENP